MTQVVDQTRRLNLIKLSKESSIMKNEKTLNSNEKKVYNTHSLTFLFCEYKFTKQKNLIQKTKNPFVMVLINSSQSYTKLNSQIGRFGGGD